MPATRISSGERQMQALTYAQKCHILAREGYDDRDYLGAVAPPVFPASTYAYEDKPYDASPYVYASLGNPNTSIAAAKLAAVESGEKAMLFSSGMAAIQSVVFSLLSAGAHAVVLGHIYESAAKLFSQAQKRFHASVTRLSSERDLEGAMRPGTRLVYLETPSSAVFELFDIAHIAGLAHANGALLAVDNTWATPIYQNPLHLGADFAVHSATKFLGGNNDLLAGVVVGNKPAMKSLLTFRADLDPQRAWLLNRSLASLPMRMQHHMASGLKVAEFLETHPRVLRVLHPGLETHPCHALGKKQMSGYSGLFSFVPEGEPADVIRKLRIFRHAWSYGGPTSLVLDYGHSVAKELQALDLPPKLIRLHIGFEDPEALIADLDQALCG